MMVCECDVGYDCDGMWMWCGLWLWWYVNVTRVIIVMVCDVGYDCDGMWMWRGLWLWWYVNVTWVMIMTMRKLWLCVFNVAFNIISFSSWVPFYCWTDTWDISNYHGDRLETYRILSSKKWDIYLRYLPINGIKSLHIDVLIRVVVFHATFNNISVISWRSVLLVEETGVPGEDNGPAASHWQTLSHNVVSSTPRTVNFSSDRPWLHR